MARTRWLTLAFALVLACAEARALPLAYALDFVPGGSPPIEVTGRLVVDDAFLVRDAELLCPDACLSFEVTLRSEDWNGDFDLSDRFLRLAAFTDAGGAVEALEVDPIVDLDGDFAPALTLGRDGSYAIRLSALAGAPALVAGAYTVRPVPEPAPGVGVSAGLVGLAFWRRRRAGR